MVGSFVGGFVLFRFLLFASLIVLVGRSASSARFVCCLCYLVWRLLGTSLFVVSWFVLLCYWYCGLCVVNSVVLIKFILF